ncbi:ATP-binding protein [Hirschia litorea]|uniref:histidine kinase n=1 Tax=Hirschia litorea TaxID=1199156 RepID=A0ABW2INL2_9PROT
MTDPNDMSAETSRLEELSAFNLLDTPPEPFFDKITRSAAAICDVPISLISLVDRDRQWFKSTVGLNAGETPRDVAFCSHAIEGKTHFLVEDATKDPRFNENPLVTGELGIRSYAGMPLITRKGHAIGTLCVIHTKPVRFTKSQLDQLKVLAEILVEHMEERRRWFQLQSAGARLVNFITQSPSAMALLDKEMRYLALSPRWAADYGLNAYEVIGKSHYDALPEVSEQEKEVNNRCLNGAIERQRNYKFMRADGRAQYLNFEIRPWYDDDQKVGGIVIYTEDVTREQEMISSLKASEVRLRQSLLLSGSAAWEVDVQRQTIHYSANLADFLGRPPQGEEVLSDIWRFIYKDDVQAVKKAWNLHRAGGPPVNLDHRFLHAEGHPVWVRSTVEIQRDEQGTPIRIIGMSHDISESKGIEIALEKAYQVAQAADDAKTTFLATISHEIKTPIHNIGGFAEILKESKNLSSTERHHVDLIFRSCEMLESLVGDVLDVTTMQAKGMTLRPAIVDVGQLAKDLENLFASKANEKDLDFTVNIAGGLAGNHIVDRTRLQQVLSNLVGNALKFTDCGSVRLSVDTLVNDEARQTLRFKVEDTGEGIPSNQLQHIFKEFHQVERESTTLAAGVGLGLSVCRGLVELMGGQLQVTSSETEGTTFWFDLDLEIVQTAQQSEEVKVEPSKDKAASFSGRRVLLVDDLELNHELIRTILSPLGCVIDSAFDGPSAIRASQNANYDIILMDIRMQGMDGIAATKAIRDLGGNLADVPIIALTANVISSQIDTYFDAGMNDVVEKSASRKGLLKTIIRWLPNASEQTIPETDSVEKDKDLLDGFYYQLHAFVQDLTIKPKVEDQMYLLSVQTACHQMSGISGALGFADLAALTGDLDKKISEDGELSQTMVEACVKASKEILERSKIGVK